MVKRVFLVLIVLGLSLTGYAYWSAVRDPVQREVQIAVADWPANAAPMRIILISDIHVAGPDMPPERLERIVTRLNALEPDLVLIAGDFVSDKALSTHRYAAAEAVAPLAALEAEYGVFAVLGNHDHWRDAPAFRAALPDAGVVLLDNEAVAAGPVALIGIGDDFTGHADVAAAMTTASELSGPVVVLSHSPDIVPDLPNPVALVAAGHTHCGQIRLPIIGRLATASRYGERFACGQIDDDGQTVVVTAGLGTSILPIRLGVPPDFWLIELGPER
jgi:predicted MPP superfamily phosphohydrolase